MLKCTTHPVTTTSVINTRLKLGPLVGRLDSSGSNSTIASPNLGPTLLSPAAPTPPTVSPCGPPPPPPGITYTPASVSSIHTTAPGLQTREFTAEEAYARRYKPMIMVSHSSRDSSPVSVSQAPREERRANSRGIGSWFPLGYKEAVSQWWSSLTPSTAERNVLGYVPYLKEATTSSPELSNPTTLNDPHGNRIWRSAVVQLSGKNRALNEFSIERVGEEEEETLVILHGYGAGLGFFYKNFEPLSRLPGWKLYALDMLGMGNSARPPFKITAKDQKGKIEQSENWFVDSLEEWRKIKKIENFTLLGHSLGGYLAVSYAIKYPGRLNKLILASPVGIPADPYAVNADMPEPMDSTVANEFTADQEETTTHHGNGSASNVSADGSLNSENKKDKVGAKGTEGPRRPMPGWFTWLWDANVSPFSIVRMTGPLGPRFVSGWTSRRFNHLPRDEAQALHDYSYALFRQRGSGEYALPYLLAPGAYARSPVINRIQKVGRQTIRPATETTPAVREAGYPVVMMYGENDWMDVAGGFAAKQKILRTCEKALLDGNRTAEERERENGGAEVKVIPAAGHHLYLDNPEGFNRAVTREMKETQGWMRKMRGLIPRV